MGLAVVYARASVGIDAPLVTVEVHLANGLPQFNLVGLAETSVREARERVRSALLNSGFEFPARRITVNLGPADLPKGGGNFDLAIAVGIIAAEGLIPKQALERVELVGELALSGKLMPIAGALPISFACQRAGRALIMAADNAQEASLIRQAQILPAQSLHQVYLHFRQQQVLSRFHSPQLTQRQQHDVDMQEVVGQPYAKRALEIAATGGHNVLMCGPPGSGKSMLATRFVTLLPLLEEQQALEAATIYSVAGKPIEPSSWRLPKLRQPHHTASAVSLVGGGSIPRPGEISLAHHGVLFLDELPEFERKVLDVLREPLESGHVSIARAARQTSFPANFQFIAAMNPSPTGSLGDGRCSEQQILRYLQKISGPLLERIDLQLDVPAVPLSELQQTNNEETSEQIRQRVLAGRERQATRGPTLNARLSNKDVSRFCRLSAADQQFLQQAATRMALSMRSHQRVVKIARTIADLAGCDNIERPHLAEALGYRGFERMLRKLTGEQPAMPPPPPAPVAATRR